MERLEPGCTPHNSVQCTDVSSHVAFAFALAGSKQQERKYNCSQCYPVSFILIFKVAAVKYSE